MSESRHNVVCDRLGFVAVRSTPSAGQPWRVEYNEGGGTIRLRTTTNALASLQSSSEWAGVSHTPGAGSVVLDPTARKVAIEVLTLGSPAPTAVVVSTGVEGAVMARQRGPGQPELAVDNFSPAGPPAPFSWWDASDLTTLFQVNDGTVPVTSNGDPLLYIGNKGNGTTVALTGTGAGRTWETPSPMGIGSVALASAASLSGVNDASTVNGGWTYAAIISNEVSADFAQLMATPSDGKTAMGNVVGNYLVSLGGTNYTFTDYTVEVDTPVVIIASYATGGIANAIMSKSTQIKSATAGTFAELLVSENASFVGGTAAMNVGEMRVWDALVDFELIKSDFSSKWGTVWA